MRCLIAIFSLLFISCEKIDVIPEIKKEIKIPLSSDLNPIQIDVFLKKPSKIEYRSRGQKFTHESSVMTAIVLYDTLKAGDEIYLDLNSLSYDNQMSYTLIDLKRNKIIKQRTGNSHLLQLYFKQD